MWKAGHGMKLVEKIGRVWKSLLKLPEVGHFVTAWFLEQKLGGLNVLEEARLSLFEPNVFY
jgi:hypothetical protein